MSILEQAKRELVRQIADKCKPYVFDSSSAPSNPAFEDMVSAVVDAGLRGIETTFEKLLQIAAADEAATRLIVELHRRKMAGEEYYTVAVDIDKIIEGRNVFLTDPAIQSLIQSFAEQIRKSEGQS